MEVHFQDSLRQGNFFFGANFASFSIKYCKGITIWELHIWQELRFSAWRNILGKMTNSRLFKFVVKVFMA